MEAIVFFVVLAGSVIGVWAIALGRVLQRRREDAALLRWLERESTTGTTNPLYWGGYVQSNHHVQVNPDAGVQMWVGQTGVSYPTTN